MKREAFISDLQVVAIELSEGSIDLDEAQKSLEDIAKDFCDHYEQKFISIKDKLDGASDFVPLASEAWDVAEKASSDLY